ncbi:MAG: hypothetical protein WCL54_06875 [Clostridia bacterium]
MIKKIALLLFAFMIGLTLILSGCDKKPVETPKKVEFDKTVVKTSKYINGYKYDPPVTVTKIQFYGPQVLFQPGEDIDHNVWTKAYEDYCGIKLKSLWTVTDFQKYDLKVTTSIATDSLPDLMPIYTTLFFRVADSGRAMDLKPFYDKYLDPELKTAMETASGGIAYKTCFRNGILAGIASPPAQSVNMQWIRKDWLDRYQQPWPKNINESIKLMKLFCKKNPGAPASPQTFAFPMTTGIATGFENAFGAYYGIWIDDGNGGLTRSDVSPKWKPVLQILSDLYAEQYIDNDFTLNAQSVMDTQMTNQQYGFMFGAATAPDGTLYNTIAYNPKAVWQSSEILDEQGNPAKMQVETRIGGFNCVNVKSKYPAALMLMTNVFGDLMGGIGIEFRKYHDFLGTDGAHYDSFFYPFAGFSYPPVNNAEIIAKAIKTQEFSKLTGEQLGIVEKFKDWTQKQDAYGWRLWAILRAGGSYETQHRIIQNDNIYPNRGWGPETPTWIDKGPDLFNFNRNIFAQIIRGDKMVDSGFEEWTTYYQNNGGTQCDQEMSDWWKAEGKVTFDTFMTTNK